MIEQAKQVAARLWSLGSYVGPIESANTIHALIAALEAKPLTKADQQCLLIGEEITGLQKALEAAQRDADQLHDLLCEVSAQFTRDDDLPDSLLPRIDAAIAAQGAKHEAA